MKVPSSPSLNPEDQVTIDFWMKADTDNPMSDCCQGLVTTDFYGVEISGGSGPRFGVNFFISTDEGKHFIHASDSVGGGIPVSSDEWHHVIGMCDGSNLMLYIDGDL